MYLTHNIHSGVVKLIDVSKRFFFGEFLQRDFKIFLVYKIFQELYTIKRKEM